MSGSVAYVVALAAFVALGTFMYGYDSGIVTITISKRSWNDYMGSPSPNYVGAVASVYSAAQAFGCLLQALVGDSLGRIRFLQIMVILEVIGVSMQAGATSMGMFVAGRAVAGLPTGAVYLTTILWLVEISPPRKRGLIAGAGGLSVGFGIMLASWLGYACSHLDHHHTLQWRLPIALQAPWGLVLLVGLTTFVPESPRHLVWKVNIEQGRTVFVSIRRYLNYFQVQKHFARIQAQLDFEKHRKLSYREFIRVHGKRALCAFIAAIMTSVTGAQVTGYYQVQLYRTLGIDQQLRILLAGVYGTVCLLAILLTDKFVLDRWGRRNLMLCGLIGCIAAQVYAAVMQYHYQDGTNQVGKGFAVGGIYLLTAVHYAAFGSAAGIYQAEVLPISLRSKLMSINGFFSFSIIAGFSEAAPKAFETIKHNYYYIFVALTSVCLVVAWMCFPETMHLHLEEIPALFGDQIFDGKDAEQQTINDKDTRETSWYDDSCSRL